MTKQPSMSKNVFGFRAMFWCAAAVLTVGGQTAWAETAPADMSQSLQESIVYLQITTYPYDPYRPWKRADLDEKSGYAAAVGPREVITTAYNVADAAYIKARRYGQNEWIAAQVKVIDYEGNLCLLELDPNTLQKPLTPIAFSEDYSNGSELDFYWLSDSARLYRGRGYLDRADSYPSPLSYAKFLNFVVGNISQRAGNAQLFCHGDKPIGLACWYNSKEKESGIIPGLFINHFLADVADGHYDGFPALGFAATELLAPDTRNWLKLPPEQKNGIYVGDVYTLGTGADVLKKQDVILAIDGTSINANARFEHPLFKQLAFEYLITSKNVGATLNFDIWRDGAAQRVAVPARNFAATEMLVPYYEYGRQSQYLMTGGFLLQSLTGKYLTSAGENWQAKVSSHLFHYYSDLAFKPSPERREIVILSYVLPADINLGYQDLRQLVVAWVNGMPIARLADVVAAQKLNPESRYDVIEFEFDNPTVVIPREQLPAANALIGRNYGISQLAHVNP
jgi:hypothetical protein